jgi:hypothetical protein
LFHSNWGLFIDIPFRYTFGSRIFFSLYVRRHEMSSYPYGSYEANDLEDLMESDGMYEQEWESGSDFEDEGDPFDIENPDPFLGDLVNAIPRSVRGPLKDLARKGATLAAGAIGGQRGARIGQGVADAVLNNMNWESGDMEDENEPLGEFETVGGDTDILREMSHLASLAAEAESPAQADQFLGAIAGLAGKLIPQLIGGLTGGDGEEESWDHERDEFLPLIPLAAQALPMAMPLISKGIGAIGSLFRRKPQTRRLMKTLPVIAARSATSLVKQARAGRRIKPSTVAAVMAKQTAKTLATKPAVSNAVQANNAMANGVHQPYTQNTYGGDGGSYNGASYTGRPRRSRVIRPRAVVIYH